MQILTKSDEEISIHYSLTNNYDLIIDGVENCFSLIQNKNNPVLIERWGFDDFPDREDVFNKLLLIYNKYNLMLINYDQTKIKIRYPDKK